MSDASVVFLKQVDDVPWVDVGTSSESARPAARMEWISGDPASGPWIYYVEHPAEDVTRPHTYDARRVEHVLDREIERFVGSEELAWHRRSTLVQGARSRGGTVSWLRPGTAHGHRIVEAPMLLQDSDENPPARTIHLDTAGEGAEHGADDRKGEA